MAQEKLYEDNIYIDCQPVEIINNETTDSNSDNGLSKSINGEIIDDISKHEINIFDNIGFQSILAVGIFAIILFSGNYVFKTLPNNRLEKAINKDMYS